MAHDTDGRVRQQTRSWLNAISDDLRQAVGQEIEGLRTSLDQRITALEATVLRTDDLFEQLTLRIHDLATDEAQAAAMDARQRSEADAQSEIGALQARLQSELETARTEFDARRTGLEAQLAETERDIAAIRRHRDDLVVSLDEARQRLDALEEANAQIARFRQIADARLEEEVQRRTAIAMQLDAARQEIQLAKAEADSGRLEARLAVERIRVLEDRQRHLEQLGVQTRTSPLDGENLALLTHLKERLDDLGSVKGEELLSRLIECLGDWFGATAVFTVEAQRLKLWKSRAGDVPAAVAATQALSLDGESPLARAFRHRTTVNIDASSADGTLGLWSAPLGHAMALPIQAWGRVVALAYVENPPAQSDDRVQMLEAIAEILVGYVNLRLNRHQPPAELAAAPQVNTPEPDDSEDTLSRHAHRVKLDPPVEILVEGVACTLVNISALGAQIVSPFHLRLNRCVRIATANGSSGLSCEGRIVWARLESAGAGLVAYRAGVRFMGVEPQTVMTFISQHQSAAGLVS